MHTHRFILTLRRGLCTLALLLVAGQAFAAGVYHVRIDSSAFAGTGWLDLQFNPGMDGAPQASAIVSGFSGMLNGGESPQLAGDVSGTLPGPVVFGNGGFFNDLFQSVVLGGLFEFDLTFGGAFDSAISNIGSTFAISLYADDQATPLGNADPNNGSLLSFDLMPASDGQPGSISYRIADPATVTVAEVNHVVPEPSAMALVLLGIAVLGLAGLRKRPGGMGNFRNTGATA